MPALVVLLQRRYAPIVTRTYGAGGRQASRWYNISACRHEQTTTSTAAYAVVAHAAHDAPSACTSDPFAEITRARGFLPSSDPVSRLLGNEFNEHEATAAALSVLLTSRTGALRHTLSTLPPFPWQALANDVEQQWRAYQLLSFLSHAYVWGVEGPPAHRLPAVLAVPWTRVSSQLGMPPVLTYASCNLYNWKRLAPARPLELGNLASIQTFEGGQDECWFRLVHVAIEARAAGAVSGLEPMLDAVVQGDVSRVLVGLRTISSALQEMQAGLHRMSEGCDPSIYYHHVRRPMAGWKGSPDLPRGLVYEGVSDVPMQLHGATGAQSSLVHCFDAALGIEHGDGWLTAFLHTMQQHMPPAHRAFVQRLCSPVCQLPLHTIPLSPPLTSGTQSSVGGGSGGTYASIRTHGLGNHDGATHAHSNGGIPDSSSATSGKHTQGIRVLSSGGTSISSRVNTKLSRGTVLRQMCGDASAQGELRDAYNAAVTEPQAFRSLHQSFASSYISKFAAGDGSRLHMLVMQPERQCRGVQGTGGSTFMPALTGYRDTTQRHLLPG